MSSVVAVVFFPSLLYLEFLIFLNSSLKKHKLNSAWYGVENFCSIAIKWYLILFTEHQFYDTYIEEKFLYVRLACTLGF